MLFSNYLSCILWATTLLVSICYATGVILKFFCNIWTLQNLGVHFSFNANNSTKIFKDHFYDKKLRRCTSLGHFEFLVFSTGIKQFKYCIVKSRRNFLRCFTYFEEILLPNTETKSCSGFTVLSLLLYISSVRRFLTLDQTLFSCLEAFFHSVIHSY